MIARSTITGMRPAILLGNLLVVCSDINYSFQNCKKEKTSVQAKANQKQHKNDVSMSFLCPKSDGR
jgi:hypothetical protein